MSERTASNSLAHALQGNETPWYHKRHLVILNLMLIIPILSSSAGGFDGALMNGLQSLTSWNLEYGTPTGTIRGFINAAMPLGGILATFFAGHACDRFGRKITIAISASVIIAATIVQVTGFGSRAQLIVARFIVGIGGMFGQVAGPLLLAELSYPTQRGKVTSLYMTCYFLGSILSSWTCYGSSQLTTSWAWRAPTLLQAGYPAIQLIFIWFLPESPRWLVSKGRVTEAEEVLIKYHAGGDANSEMVEIEIAQIVEAITLEKSVGKTKWRDLVSTPGNRRRTYIAATLSISTQWAGNQVVAYYISVVLSSIGITSQRLQTRINGCLQIYNFVWAICGSLSVDKFGRRPMLFWTCIGMLISYIIWTIFSALFQIHGGTGNGRVVLAFIFIYYFFHAIAFAPLAASYPTEIFTFALRSKGLAMTWFVSNSGVVIGGFCNSIALDQIGWKYYILFCVILLLTAINIWFFYPETKGKSLEEIAEIFDKTPAVFTTDEKPDLAYYENTMEKTDSLV